MVEVTVLKENSLGGLEGAVYNVQAQEEEKGN